MADKAAAFLVKSFEVIGNRRGGTKERKEKRIENGNEIRGGGGGEERRGEESRVALPRPSRACFSSGPEREKQTQAAALQTRGSFFVGVVSRFGQDERKRVRFAFRSFTRRGWYCDEERGEREREKKKARARNYRHLAENGILRVEDVEIVGRQMNGRYGGHQLSGQSAIPDYIHARLSVIHAIITRQDISGESIVWRREGLREGEGSV